MDGNASLRASLGNDARSEVGCLAQWGALLRLIACMGYYG